MNKTDFIREVASRTGSTLADAEEFVYVALDIIRLQLADGGSVDFTGFGKFYTKLRAERQGKNPQTGEPITIPAANVPAFKPGKILRESVK